MKSVNAETLKHWIDRNEAVVIDVREPAEHETRNIPGSQLIPLGTLDPSRLPEHQGKKLVIYCQAGRRGTLACEKLLNATPDTELYHLEGGILAWEAAGQPVASLGKHMLPLDRQVQLTVGLSVLAATVLGYYLSPAFLLISGFFGLGLSIAGLTGFCGLAMVLARMPWNRSSQPATTCRLPSHP